MPVTITVGAIVRASGLVARADLNGQRGTVMSFNADKKRFAVSFDTGESVMVKPENLTMAMDDDATSASAFHAVDARREADRAAAAAKQQKQQDPPPGFRLWDTIKIKGLASKPELNGTTATIADWKHDKLRFGIRLHDQSTLSIKPANCERIARSAVAGEEGLSAHEVVNGDSDWGECHLCNDARLTLVSPYLQCCGQSMCNDCAVKYHADAGSCPFCRTPFPSAPEEATPSLMARCSRSDPRAFYHISAMFSVVQKDECVASSHMLALVERGYAEAKLSMAITCWRSGFVSLGRELMQSAADDGLAEAMMRLGAACESGLHGFPRSYESAVTWYKRAADKDDATACTNLAVFYFHGRGGLEQSYTEAVRWYRQAARLGSTEAMCCLAECLQQGRGCEQDVAACGKWLHVAAYMGDQSAQSMLDAAYSASRFDWRRQPPPKEFLVQQSFHKNTQKRLGIVKAPEVDDDVPEIDREVANVLGT